MKKMLRNQRGFTLGELLIVVAIVGLVMAGTYQALQGGQNAYQYGSGRVEVQQSARMAVYRMITELRTGAVVTASSATSVSFDYVDDTGATVRVTYSLNGTSLQRNQIAPASVVAQPETVIGNVNSFVLVYYDNNNVVTTIPARVRVVDIRLITQPANTTLAPGHLANQRAVFGDRVRLRNI